jgi:hypothetical protein
MQVHLQAIAVVVGAIVFKNRITACRNAIFRTDDMDNACFIFCLAGKPLSKVVFH